MNSDAEVILQQKVTLFPAERNPKTGKQTFMHVNFKHPLGLTHVSSGQIM